ncbi:MAG: acyl--CoA ligase [Beijerinckiaceae bacterium]|nr:acyl--CoA ligase [Beijerinckiaceae bacterium]
MMLPDRVATYRMVWAGVESVESILSDLRLDPQKPVGILIDNPARHLIVALALLKAGITSTSLRSDLLETAWAVGVQTVLAEGPLPLGRPWRAHFVDEKWFTRKGGDARPITQVDPARVVRLSFTSGSTGRPKAVAITHRALMARIIAGEFARLGLSERVLSLGGVSSSGFNYALQAFAAGRTICFAPQANAIECIGYFSVPEIRGSVLQIAGLLRSRNETDGWTPLARISAGAAYLPVELAEEIRTAFGCEIANPYASVEAGRIACADGEMIRQRRRIGNCFAPMADIQIVAETDEPLPVGEEGRIRVRSDAMAWPFDGALLETRRADGEDWCYTGDLGRMSRDGLLFITGRADEVLNSGGVKVNPEALEEALRRHGALGDVGVVRMRSETGGDEPWLATTAARPATLEEVHAWLGAHLSGEIAGFRFSRLARVDEIPKTSLGKVARAALRDILRRADG